MKKKRGDYCAECERLRNVLVKMRITLAGLHANSKNLTLDLVQLSGDLETLYGKARSEAELP